MRDYILHDVKEGGPIHYVGEDGEEKIRVGSYKGHWRGPAHVLTGGISGFHPQRGVPYTIRERARLQGFPDDFEFFGTVYDQEDGQRVWNHDKNMHMVRQTGKAMPIQFCEYVSAQVAAHIAGAHWLDDVRATNARVIAPNAYVDEAKAWYCANVGYANQKLACQTCSQARGCAIREAKHIPLAQNQARLVGVSAGSRGVAPRETPAPPSLRTDASKDKHLASADLGESRQTARRAPKSKGSASKTDAPPSIPVPTRMMDFD